MELSEDWELAATPPGRCASPDDPAFASLSWIPARVPGTAAAAVGADGRDFDAEDWWFRVEFAGPLHRTSGELMLELDGIATVSEVFLNGRRLLESSSMFMPHAVPVGDQLRARNTLVIVCRALKPLLARRRRPAAQWRTRVVNETNLRWFRTMMFGRSPGFAPGPAPVGPWRPVRLVARSPAGVDDIAVRARVDGDRGIVIVRGRCRNASSEVQLVVGEQCRRLYPAPDGTLEGELTIDGVQRWWPHTHGDPYLYEVALEVDGEPVSRRRVGFRSLEFPDDIIGEGLQLAINGVDVFVRGAVWTPADLVGMAPDEPTLRALLQRVRDAGMNLLRVVGTGAYEPPAFHDLCDELGILVWQDLMFANVDYPLADADFRATVEHEAEHVLDDLAGRPSFVVLCGNSEVEQQPAMMGLDPSLGRDPFWESTVPELVVASDADCAYLRSTPCGGDLPFHPDGGTVHYFEVSGYFHPPADARRSDVRFAAECLAFANVPDTVEVPVHHPRWKQGVARDAGSGWDVGAGWDFDDVRDHYLALLYGVDPVQLRRVEHARYLDLSRAASGEVMAEVMGVWRRTGSNCRGALVLWCKDMLPGAGLGILDVDGAPKVAYHYLRRALAPVAVWTTDEGVGGVAVHVANDGCRPLRARLRVALYRDGDTRVDEAVEEIELPPYGQRRYTVEGMLGRFVDAAWAYRFGPPTADVIVASVEGPDQQLISQAFRFPAGFPTRRERNTELGLEGAARTASEHSLELTIRAQRLAYGVRLDVPGFVPDDDAFSVEPGHPRTVRLTPTAPGASFARGTLTALNLAEGVAVENQA